MPATGLESARARADGRLHFLDSLRGIAAVYVVLFHVLLVPRPVPPLDDPLLSKLVHFGGTGVFLFFVISGFSLCLTKQRHERTGHTALSYGISRLFRIAPLFYALLLASLARDVFLLDKSIYLRPIAYNLTFVFNFVPHQQEGIVWASWTIGVEMIFYALFLPLSRLNRLWQAATVLASSAVFYVMQRVLPPDYVYWTVIGYYPLFVFGMWAHDAYVALVDRGQAAWLSPVLVVSGLTLLALCASVELAEKNLWLRGPIGIGYSMLLIGLGLSRRDLLDAGVFRFFGRISYSVYLLHALIILLLGPVLAWLHASLPHRVIFPAYSLIVIAISTAFGYGTYRLIEAPGVRLGNRVFAALSPVFDRRREGIGGPRHEAA